MQKVATPYLKNTLKIYDLHEPQSNGRLMPRAQYLDRDTKVLAWTIFLMLFIEAGTIGIIPKNFYFVYRNVRLSDIILYALIVYSIFRIKDYIDLLNSRVLLIVKIMMLYMLFEFIVSIITYKVDFIEYFFRMKILWMSLLVLPFLLLAKKGGIVYLIKLILPFAVLSNILYILSALTGIAFLPDIGIVQQTLPGGLEVYRVYGGTFYGEMFMIGIIFCWNEFKFRLVQVPFLILFTLPHILAFGRGAWVFLSFSVFFVIAWSSIRNHSFRTLARQIVMIIVTVSAFLYFFNQFIPRSDEISEAISVRMQQGQDDLKYNEGTFGTRMSSINVLLEVWSANPIFGIGMHPLWVIKPVTNEENIIGWGFADIRWTGVLAAYGIIGFLIAVIFQIYYLLLSFKMMRKIKVIDMNYFLLLSFFLTLFRDLIINYTYYLTTIGLNALGPFIAFYVAITVYLYEKHMGHSSATEKTQTASK